MTGEEIILKVGARTKPGAFAGAIYNNIMEGKHVLARAFGMNAYGVMSQGIALAYEYFESNGKRMYCHMSSRREADGLDDRDIRSFTVAFMVVDAPPDDA